MLLHILTLCSFLAFAQTPQQPADPAHPGSASYTYDFEKQSLSINGRAIDVYMPKAQVKAPVIIFGHGQAMNSSVYEDSFIHFAKKGVAVIHPNYDSGFFDQDWARMAKDYNSLTEKVLSQFADRMDANKLIYSGHSKGGYVALMAAAETNNLNPSALVLFAPADYNATYLKRLDSQLPLTIVWGEKDSIIKKAKMQEIYNLAPSAYKQFIEVKSYPNLQADHYLPMTKSTFVGGFNGANAFHYYGTWKWLLGAVWDMENKSPLINSYIYGEEATSTGSDFRHGLQRSWTLFNSQKVASFLDQKISAEGNADIIVYLKDKAQLTEAQSIVVRSERTRFVQRQLISTAERSQKNLLNALNANNIEHKAFYIENAIAIKSATKEMIDWISNFEEVSYISIDAKAKLKLPDTTEIKALKTEGVASHLQVIKADKVWNELGVKGKGIVVAGQDTGYMWNHNALKNQYRGTSAKGTDHNYNWHDAFTTCKDQPCDDHSHGTHTMGTILGFDGGQNQIGVAPEAQWIGCRNMLNGVGSVSSYLECFEFFLAPYPTNGNSRTDGRADLAPHIVNNSWGCPESEGCTGGEFLDAIKALKSAGIAVVVAAGNEGPNCGTVAAPPAYYTGEVISVGAYNRYTKDIAFFSSLGPSTWDGGLAPDLIAPGEIIRSAVNKGTSSYDDKGGTSMAAPQVAGAIALLWSAKPELIGQVDKTFEILKKSATPMTSRNTCGKFPGSSVPNAVYGFGMLDAFAAVSN